MALVEAKDISEVATQGIRFA